MTKQNISGTKLGAQYPDSLSVERQHAVARTPREQLESWVLALSREAMAADPIATDEVIRTLTGGHESFCLEPYSGECLHRTAAAFLRISRL